MENQEQTTTETIVEDSTKTNSSENTVKENTDNREIIPRLEKPSVSKEEFRNIRRDLSNLRQKKEALFEIRSVISKEIKNLFSKLKDLKDGRDQLTKKVQELKGDRDKINTEIKGEIDKVKELRDVKVEGTSINTAAIKSIIEKMQYYLETNPLSPDEEKKVMKTIKEKQKLLDKAKETSASKSNLKDTSIKIDDLKDKSNKIHADVEVSAKQSQEKHESLISISKDIKYLKSQEKEVHSLFMVSKEAYKGKRIAYIQNKSFFEAKRPKKENNSREYNEEMIIKKMEKTIEEKIRSGQKITTEDLLSFRPN